MKKLLAVILLLSLPICLRAQTFTNVDAGPDQNIDCSTANCVDLSADFLETGFSLLHMKYLLLHMTRLQLLIREQKL